MPEISKIVDTGDVISITQLVNVLGIRATCKATVASAGGPSQDNSNVRIHEIEADYYITVDRGYAGII